MLNGIESSLSEIGLNVTILFLIIIWTIFWKLIALWHSARKGHLVWFVVMALFNTIGIIPILYLFVFKDLKSNKKEKTHEIKEISLEEKKISPKKKISKKKPQKKTSYNKKASKPKK